MNDAGFLNRWSRRKLGADKGAQVGPEPGQGPATAVSAPAAEKEFADFDFQSLDFHSDYRRFMKAAVPDEVRRKALRKLWSSNDIISQPDELDDYLEDFREEVMGLPEGMAKSAYEIGRGFLPAAADPPSESTREATGNETAEPAAASGVQKAETEAAPADARRDADGSTGQRQS